MGIGFTEIIIILVIVLVIFGVGRLPEVGKGLGKGIREFRNAAKGELEEAPKSAAEDEKKNGT
jgi:sec-independent protein translocase protein TatA